MTSLASGVVFAAIRGVDYDAGDTVAAFHLEAASGLVESYCRRSFLAVEEDEITLDGSGGNSLVLPSPPVWDVLYVAVDGTEIDPELYVWNEEAGTVDYKETCYSAWTRGRQNVTVVYSHGYYVDEDEGEPVLPAEVALVVFQLAQRGMYLGTTGGNTGTVTSESIGSYSVSYASGDTQTTTSVGLAPLERAALAPYRLTRIGRS